MTTPSTDITNARVSKILNQGKDLVFTKKPAPPLPPGLMGEALMAYRASAPFLRSIDSPTTIRQPQQKQLKTEVKQEDSVYNQYLAEAGLTKASDPLHMDDLISEEASAQQFDWSQMDLQGALDMLGISSSDALASAKISLQQDQVVSSQVSGAAGIVGAIMSFL